MRHGKSHYIGLGSAMGRNAVKLAEARERTRELHTIVRRDGRDPPYAGALRARLALKSAAACAKILRLNGDEGALRDLRFAVGDDSGPAAKLLRLWRELADGRPPSTRAGSSPRQPRSTWLYPTRTASHPT
jgi:Protein of unknown function (DUF1403)